MIILSSVIDKYSYDSWMDKPEMIPKGRSYFEVGRTSTIYAVSALS